MRVFISYSTKDGLDVAREARRIFFEAGHSAWMYEHDGTIGALTWTEISSKIVLETDVVLYICSTSSANCYGQEREANYALNNRVKILVVRLDRAEVPAVLSADNYATWARSEFAGRCAGLAQALPEITEQIRALNAACEAKQESSQMERRLKYVRDLNARVGSLDSKRVTDFKESVWRSYESATLPRQVASISQQLDPGDPEARTIELWARIKLGDFNDADFIWGPYFSDVGRAVVAGERNYLQRTIQEQVGTNSATISRSNPQFEVLTDIVHSWPSKDLDPDTLLAPVNMEVPFAKFYRNQIDWSTRPERLTMGHTRLRVFWSHRYAPLDRFIVSCSRAGTWHVIPDEQTGRPLTVALGQSKLFPDEVEYGVETTVSYKVTRPEGFCIVPLGT